MKVRHRFLPLAGFVALTTLATFPASAAEYNIVMINGLTNVFAFAGVPLGNGAKLAVDHINASGELGAGNKIVFRMEDTGGDRAQAVTLVTKFGNDPSNLVMLGPLTTNEVTAAGPVLAEVKIPELVVAQDIQQITPLVFPIVESPQAFMPKIAQFAVDKLGVKRCAFITNGENQGLVLNRDIARDYMKGRGTTIVADELVKSADTDYSAISTKIVAANPDCISLSLTPAPAANVVIQMRQAGLGSNVKIIGSTGIASPAFIKAGGKAVEGAYAVTEFNPPGATEQARAFTKAYTERYGSEPDSWAAIGYAEVQLAASAIVRAGPTPTREKIREALAQTKDVPIVLGTGKITMNPERKAQFGLSIVEVKDGKYTIVP